MASDSVDNGSEGLVICQHPYLALAYTALGYNQNNTGSAKMAHASHTAAMNIRKAVLGASCLDVALSQNQVAISLKVGGLDRVSPRSQLTLCRYAQQASHP